MINLLLPVEAPEISWKMKTEQPTLPPLGWLTSCSASLTRYYEQNCLKNLPRLLWTNESLVSSKSQTRHAACWRRYPNLDSELKLLCHAGLKFREISAGFNVSTRSDLSEQKNSKLMLSASRVAWPFCSTVLIDKNVIKCHMRNVTLQFFTNVECKSSLFKVEPLFFSLEKVPCILRLTIHGPEKVPQKNGVPSSFGLPWVAPHRPDPPCGKPTWNLWIFLPDSLRVKTLQFFATNKLKTWWKYHLLYCEGAGVSRTVALVGEENLAVFLIHSCKVACITCCIVSHTYQL